jgi:hypothetical protein
MTGVAGCPGSFSNASPTTVHTRGKSVAETSTNLTIRYKLEVTTSGWGKGAEPSRYIGAGKTRRRPRNLLLQVDANEGVQTGSYKRIEASFEGRQYL